MWWAYPAQLIREAGAKSFYSSMNIENSNVFYQNPQKLYYKHNRQKCFIFNEYSNVFYQNSQLGVACQLALCSRCFHYDFYTLMLRLSGM